MIFRTVATGLTAAGVAALAIGPVRVLLDQNDGTGDDPVGRSALVLTETPGRAPGWRPGLVDTVAALPGEDVRTVPRSALVDFAEAAALVDDPDTLSVVGGARDEQLPGVGAVVTTADAERLLALPEPRRTRVVARVVDSRALGLSVLAVDGLPDRAVVVETTSGRKRRALLERTSPAVAELAAGWAQLRPDLRALVSRGPATGDAASDPEPAEGSPSTAEPGSRGWRRLVSRAVRREILPALGRGRAPVAAHLLEGEDALLTLADGPARPTARGAAYAVAAWAVQPGSRLLEVRGGSAVDARVLQRPDGRTAVLVWNPGAARTLTVQLPDGTGVRRHALRLAAGSFSAAVLR